MTHSGEGTVPVWPLATKDDTRMPGIFEGTRTMSPQRLAELRSALAAFADSPVVTLEAHPMPKEFDRSVGIPLDAMSPLAKHLSELVTRTALSASTPADVAGSGELLYRMVVPAKVAAQVGKGLVRPMVAKGVAGGIRGPLVDASGVVAQASFVPVPAEAATAGAVSGAAGTAGAAAAGAGALTVAAPLVLMAVAVGVSAYADHQRQRAIENITRLLEKLHSDNLDRERADLNGCQDAIDKATSILLDRGKIGASLGLDSAVNVIDTAIALARDRLARWRTAVDRLPEGPVPLDRVTSEFRGIEGRGGEFRAHLELAALAIALKRRVVVLQAVEHGQGDETNPFEQFVKSLQQDNARVDKLEGDIAAVLTQISGLRLRAPERLRETLLPRGNVDALLRASYRLRDLADDVRSGGHVTDVVIEIVKNGDGSILVLPATAI
ncbi:hypothetical protein [Allobranchiibius sp. GilTou73]|uniref:hypothetical protein n=1 Tax=Allobranchiibius sp. GilTou73 TaxID=2904523 RepID=UPI001F1E473E|nr:hypothetical protein [Allobranchiibius sp. GilTou73]UIJ35132.1 hypothetical protein LVQ62_01600 [Allobranchiibius sp. GilTou73]